MRHPQSLQEDRHEAELLKMAPNMDRSFLLGSDHDLDRRDGISYVMTFDSRGRKSATAQAALRCDRLIEHRFPPVNFSQMDPEDL